MPRAVIYAASHRKGGNSDRAADLLAEGVRRAGGEADILFIRQYAVRPCLACGVCDRGAGITGHKRCVLGTKDQAWELFEPIFTAPAVFFASPIYFYHLPSMFKTWIDRGQQFWRAQLDGEPWIADLPERAARTVLVAGQPSGDKLFEGARLTLKYFVQNFNMDLAAPVVFRGVDAPGDLAGRMDDEQAIIDLGMAGWEARPS